MRRPRPQAGARLFAHPVYTEPSALGGGDPAPSFVTRLPPPRRTRRPAGAPDTPFGRLIGQYRGSFLLLEDDWGLVIVDQHVAHERVLYERIRAGSAASTAPSQRLLEPVLLEVDEAAVGRSGRGSATCSAGSASRPSLFGPTTIRLSALPPEADPADAGEVVEELLERATALDGVPERVVEELRRRAGGVLVVPPADQGQPRPDRAGAAGSACRIWWPRRTPTAVRTGGRSSSGSARRRWNAGWGGGDAARVLAPDRGTDLHSLRGLPAVLRQPRRACRRWRWFPARLPPGRGRWSPTSSSTAGACSGSSSRCSCCGSWPSRSRTLGLATIPALFWLVSTVGAALAALVLGSPLAGDTVFIGLAAVHLRHAVPGDGVSAVLHSCRSR